jgi:membrane protein implicated in regulation of membrane protease activity
MALWQVWWVWLVGAGILAILEILLPGFVLLGFAVGAAATGLLMLIGAVGGSLGPVAMVFALASLAGWYGLRAIFGKQSGQVKIVERDINEN